MTSEMLSADADKALLNTKCEHIIFLKVSGALQIIPWFLNQCLDIKAKFSNQAICTNAA